MGGGATADVSGTVVRGRVADASGEAEKGCEDGVKRAGPRGDTGRGQQGRSGSEAMCGNLGIGEDASLHGGRERFR